MKLKEYLEERGMPQAVFARRVGISQGTVRNILGEHRALSVEIAVRIEKFTLGKVTCADLAFSKNKVDKNRENCEDQKNDHGNSKVAEFFQSI